MESVRHLLNQQVMVAVDVDAMLTALKNRPGTNQFVRQAKERYRIAVNNRKRVQEQLEQLLTDLTNRIIDRSTYEYTKKRYEDRLNDALEEEQYAMEDMNAVPTTIAASKQWVNALYQYCELPEITRELIELLIDCVKIMDGSNIRVVLRYSNPYSHLESLKQRMEEICHAV